MWWYLYSLCDDNYLTYDDNYCLRGIWNSHIINQQLPGKFQRRTNKQNRVYIESGNCLSQVVLSFWSVVTKNKINSSMTFKNIVQLTHYFWVHCFRKILSYGKKKCTPVKSKWHSTFLSRFHNFINLETLIKMSTSEIQISNIMITKGPFGRWTRGPLQVWPCRIVHRPFSHQINPTAFRKLFYFRTQYFLSVNNYVVTKTKNSKRKYIWTSIKLI